MSLENLVVVYFPLKYLRMTFPLSLTKLEGKRNGKGKEKKKKKAHSCLHVKKKNLNTSWHTAEWNSYSITVLLSLSVLTEHSGISLPDFE